MDVPPGQGRQLATIRPPAGLGPRRLYQPLEGRWKALPVRRRPHRETSYFSSPGTLLQAPRSVAGLLLPIAPQAVQSVNLSGKPQCCTGC
jgi:hypothetical protein